MINSNPMSFRSILAALFLSIFFSGFSQSYTFTPAGATGRFGPTTTQVFNAYASTNLNGSVTVSNGIQSFTVPVTGPYRIDAVGAAGGNATVYVGGAGSKISGEYTLTAGTVIQILVGQKGGNSQNSGGWYVGGGGGGASFVRISNTLALAAGGGGGAGSGEYGQNGFNGANSTTATAGTVPNGTSVYNGSPGSNGFGGTGGNHYSGGGGAGYSGSGTAGSSGGGGGQSYLLGGNGGSSGIYSSAVGGPGGFGGGAGGMFGGGGGGGYSGGAGGTHGANYNATGGGGGGSYNSSSSQTNIPGFNAGDGYVIISRLSGVTITRISPVGCYGQFTGALSASVTGGAPPFSYSWSPIGLTTQTISNLSAGVYSAIVTDAASNTFVASYTLTEPPLLQNVVVNQTNLTCNGGSDGSISLSVFGGTSPYTYTWLPSGGSTNVATNLSAGTYTALIKDANNCTNTRVVTLTQPPPISVAGFATSPVICQGAPTTLVAAGALTYTWSHGVTNGIQFNPTSTQNYTVTGTNAAGCTGKAVVTVTVLPSPNVQIAASSSIICSGNSSNLLASGALTYTWNTTATGNAITVSPLVNTTYTVTGTNAQGCSKSAVRTITVINSNPNVTASATQPSPCAGAVTRLNGGGAVTYTWSGGVTNNVNFVPGGTTTYTVTGSNACGSGTATITITVKPLPTITAVPSATAVCLGGTVSLAGAGGVSYVWTGGVTNNTPFTPLTSQNYTVTGTGSNGCQAKATQSIVVNPLPVITVNATSTLVCQGNTVALSGNGALTYTWNNGVTDGVAFSPAVTSTYNVSGTNANGCVGFAVASVSVTTPPALTISSSTTALCQGGNVTLTGSGANSYTWSNNVTNGVAFSPASSAVYVLQGSNACGTTTASVGITVYALPVVTAIASSSAVCINSTLSLTGSGAQTYTWSHSVSNGVPFYPTTGATYTVNGTDANGCKNSATIPVPVNPLPSVTTTVSATAVCPGHSVMLGGMGALTYTWTGGVVNNTPFYPSSPATYTVTGEDANGCRNFATRFIGMYNAPNVSAFSNTPAVCQGGGVTLSAFGANTYSWTNGVTNGQIFYPTVTNTYTVTGTNLSTGCTNTAAVTVTVKPIPVITGSASIPVLCQGQSTSLHGIGGTSYFWSGGILDAQSFIPPSSNSYTVTGVLNGCSSTGVVSLTVNPRPVVSGQASPSQVCAGGTVMLTGFGADTYTWSNAVQNGVPFPAVTSGTYQVSGTNTLTGCSSTNLAVASVTVHQLPNVVALQSASVVCAGTTVTFTAFGASSYTWTGGVQNSQGFVPAASGNYTVTGMNSITGCSKSATLGLIVNPLPVVTLSVSANAVCDGDSVTIVPQGAPSFTYGPAGWLPGTPFRPTATKTYTATGSDPATGCVASSVASVIVTVHARPTVSATVSDSVVCSGSPVTLNGQGAHIYLWTNGAVNGVQFNPTASGSFAVTGADTITGCTSTNTAVQFIKVLALPVLSISQSHSVLCQGESAYLFGSGALSYTWSTAETTPTIIITPFTNTSYSVIGADSNGCVSSAIISQDVSDCLGISKAGQTRQVSVYPNPGHGRLFIESAAEITISIADGLGKLVSLLKTDRDGVTEVDLQNCAKGVYYLTSPDLPGLREKIVITD